MQSLVLLDVIINTSISVSRTDLDIVNAVVEPSPLKESLEVPVALFPAGLPKYAIRLSAILATVSRLFAADAGQSDYY